MHTKTGITGESRFSFFQAGLVSGTRLGENRIEQKYGKSSSSLTVAHYSLCHRP